MRLIWTAAALADLDEALAYTQQHFPQSVLPFERLVSKTVDRIARWPRSARRVEGHPEVHVAPLVRYPYKIFYRIRGDGVEILHVHHAARLTLGA
jgi:plasmid stabilization system protein ParE